MDHMEALDSNTYKQYDELYLAETACVNDEECVGILEFFCDDNDFQLVKKGFMKRTDGFNCIHNKKASLGKSLNCYYFTMNLNSR